MLELTRIREERDQIVESLKKRNADFSGDVDGVIKVDESRRKTQAELDTLQAEMNKLSKQIGELFKQGKQEEANQAKAQTGALKEKIQGLRDQLNALQSEQTTLLYNIPNVPNDIVPNGATDQDNVEVYAHGEAVKMDSALPHWEVASKYNLIDFELGVKITGAGFPLYKGKGARLQRALINFFLDEAQKAGFEEYIPPLMINEASGYGTGQLPDKEGQMYHVTEDDSYLIPT